MVFRPLRSLLRGRMRAWTSSPPGIAAVHGCSSSWWAQRKHHAADAAFATLLVAVFSAFAAILHTYDDLDEEARKEEGTPTPTTTRTYLRSHQMLEQLRQERASYNNKAMLSDDEDKAVVQEYMEEEEEEDKAMKARFEEWIKEYGRAYKDEVEKARRFKIFKAAARCADAYNADAARAGHSARFGLNNFSDWNAQEIAPLHGTPTSRDGGYLQIIMHYLAQQEIWHQVPSAQNKVSNIYPNFI